MINREHERYLAAYKAASDATSHYVPRINNDDRIIDFVSAIVRNLNVDAAPIICGGGGPSIYEQQKPSKLIPDTDNDMEIDDGPSAPYPSTDAMGGDEPPIPVFTEWKGGACPVPGETWVRIKLRSGGIAENIASALIWRHSSWVTNDNDIVGYHLTTEPKLKLASYAGPAIPQPMPPWVPPASEAWPPEFWREEYRILAADIREALASRKVHGHELRERYERYARALEHACATQT